MKSLPRHKIIEFFGRIVNYVNLCSLYWGLRSPGKNEFFYVVVRIVGDEQAGPVGNEDTFARIQGFRIPQTIQKGNRFIRQIKTGRYREQSIIFCSCITEQAQWRGCFITVYCPIVQFYIFSNLTEYRVIPVQHGYLRILASRRGRQGNSTQQQKQRDTQG